MKIKLLTSILAGACIFFACDDEKITDAYLPSAQISPSVDEVTVFDAPFTNEFTVSNPDVSSFTITGGASEKEVTVANLSGSAEFTEADFGENWEIDGALDYETTIDFGSSQATQSFSITVVDALSATAEGTASEYDSTKVYITLEGETMFNNLGTVVVSRKVITEADPDPDFVELVSESATTEYEYEDSIMGVDYNLNDTIVYQITATAGSNSETKSVVIPVVAKEIPALMAGMLSTNEDEFSFIAEDEESDAAGSLTFTSAATVRGFTSLDVEFTSMDEMVDDFSELVAFVDANLGTGIVANVVIGDMFAFKFEDATDVYYGVMTITAVESTSIGDAEDMIEFTYAFDKKE